MSDATKGAATAATTPAKDPDFALELDRVSSGYGQTTVLRDVSLRVPTGEITALLGSNGAGKTTLLKTISGLLSVSAGTVRLLGEDVTADAAHRRADAGLCHVPEGRGFFRGLSVKDNLILQAPKGEEGRAVEQAVEVFPILGDRLQQQAGTMSGGEQQMLSMAAAYTRNPSVVLVDEASLGLAPLVVDTIFAFLESLPQRGTAVLMVDQFVGRALAVASTVYVIRRGSIVLESKADKIADSNVLEEYFGNG